MIAEGRNSTLAKSVASENFSRDYQQIAKTFLVEIPDISGDKAIQVFYEQEIFALMPYKNDSDINQFSVVWSMPKELAADLNKDKDGQRDPKEAFCDGTLRILNSNYREVAKVKFKDLFPISLSSLDFDATNTDVQFFTAEATFKYTIYDLVSSTT